LLLALLLVLLMLAVLLMLLVLVGWWCRRLSSLLVTGDYSNCELQELTILLMLHTAMALLNYPQPLILVYTTRGTGTDHHCGESAAAMRDVWTCRQQKQPRMNRRAEMKRTAGERRAEEDNRRVERRRAAGEAG
jgi:hypothetical protein